MKKSEREKQWMACLDGQMTAGEAAAFDESLSDDERQRLAAEMRLEQRIGDSLREDVPCPDALWAQVQAEMRQQQQPANVVSWRRPLYLGLAVAATILMVLSASMLNTGLEPEPELVAQILPQGFPENVTTASDLAAMSLIPAEKASIESFLSKHDIMLAVNQRPERLVQAGSQAKLIGACMGNCPKGLVVEVLIDCDGTPAKLLLARTEGYGSKLIEKAKDRGEVLQTRTIGDYTAGVVCREMTPGKEEEVEMLFDFLREPTQQIARREPNLMMADITPRAPADAGHSPLSTTGSPETFTKQMAMAAKLSDMKYRPA